MAKYAFYPLIISFLLVSCSIYAQNNRLKPSFFTKADAFFKKYVKDGNINYAKLQMGSSPLIDLLKITDNADLKNADEGTRKAFYINTYNLTVIKAIVLNYPIASVQNISGFFDGEKHKIAGQYMTLNELEKKYLFEKYKDPRLHFVLVCGAVGCPPITNFAYTPKKLDAQLDAQTRLALNDPTFVQTETTSTKVKLSELFDWYFKDFGKNKKAVFAFLNRYRTQQVNNNYKIEFKKYDWSLNDNSSVKIRGNNSNRYIASSLLPRRHYELKIFNNLYTQKIEADNSRSTFLTTFTQFLYGIHPRINAGFDVKLRSVRNATLPSSPFSVLKLDNSSQARWGLTAIGPRIRIAPVPKWTNFSVQSVWLFPVGNDLEGLSIEKTFIDWDGMVWWTQAFNDFAIGRSFSLFLQSDILLENIGRGSRFTTPVKAIFSYFPTSKSTIYTTAEYAPTWESPDYYVQAGIGVKYQITRQMEIEFLYTWFENKYLADNEGQARTINFGFRFTK